MNQACSIVYLSTNHQRRHYHEAFQHPTGFDIHGTGQDSRNCRCVDDLRRERGLCGRVRVAYASQGAAVESGPFLSIMALLVVVMGPFLVLSMVAVHAYASPNNKPYSLAALAFMIACVTDHLLHQLLAAYGEQPAQSVFGSRGARCSFRAGGRLPRSFWTTSSGIGSLGYRCCWRHRSLAETRSRLHCAL